MKQKKEYKNRQKDGIAKTETLEEFKILRLSVKKIKATSKKIPHYYCRQLGIFKHFFKDFFKNLSSLYMYTTRNFYALLEEFFLKMKDSFLRCLLTSIFIFEAIKLYCRMINNFISFSFKFFNKIF